MRVLLVARADAGLKRGGDMVLMNRYRTELARLGCDVTVTDRALRDYQPFDIVHLFNLDSSLELAEHARRASSGRRARPTIVLTPLYQKLEWALEYFAQGLGTNLGRPRTAAGLRYNAYMTLKETVRYLLISRRYHHVLPLLPSLRVSTWRRKRAVLRLLDALLVHSEAEASAIRQDYGVGPDRTFIIPVGYDAMKPGALESDTPDDYVLSVGRIEPVKNQLALVAAAERLGVPLILVGQYNLRHRRYCRRVAEAVARIPGLELRHDVPRATLAALYQGARLHVLASWAEVWPLVSVEALSAGCWIQTTVNSYERELYGTKVEYGQPSSVDSIAEAMAASLHAASPQRARHLLAAIPTWQEVALRLRAAYETLLNRGGRAQN